MHAGFLLHNDQLRPDEKILLQTTARLVLDGNQGDTVDLTGEEFIGSQTINGAVYNAYNIGGDANPDIWIQQSVGVI